MLQQNQKTGRFALPVLILGAVLISFSGIFVKLSEVGPISTGFYRMALPIPIFLLWVLFHRSRNGRKAAGRQTAGQRLANDIGLKADRRALFIVALAGIFLALDLMAWHWCLQFASVSAATLMGNTAPIWVALAGFLFFGERFGLRFLMAMTAAFAGVWLLLAGGPKGFQVHDGLAFFLGMITAITYAGYIVGGKMARRHLSTASVMLWGSVAASLLLLPAALLSEDKVVPTTMNGWAIVIGLAFLSQTVGQSLINWSLAHLPASFSSLTLLINPVASTLFAWVLLGEALVSLQILGGGVVILGILLARQGMAPKGMTHPDIAHRESAA